MRPQLVRWLTICLIFATAIVRLLIIFRAQWSIPFDLVNYFWDAEQVWRGRNPYSLWQLDLQGPRADVPPLELALLSLVTWYWRSPDAIRVFFGLCDIAALILLTYEFRRSPVRQLLWIILYGFGVGSLYLLVFEPSDKSLLFLLIVFVMIQAQSEHRWLRWSSAITIGVLAGLKWIGVFFALPVLHAASRRKHGLWILLLAAAAAVMILSHLLWFPTWRVVYEFRANRMASAPFHAGIAVVLQSLGLPMQKLYIPLLVSSWIAINLTWAHGWLDWKQALAMCLWAGVYWTPDSTPQMMWFVSMVMLLSVDWSSWQRTLAVWIAGTFVVWVAASSVYHLIGGPLDLSWATELTEPYGSVRMAILSQALVLVCLFFIIRDALSRKRHEKEAIGSATSPDLGTAVE